MSNFDTQYIKLCNDILTRGYMAPNRTGTPTYKVPHQVLQFDLSAEFPILTTKQIAFKTAVKELFWIYRDQSNSVAELQAQNVHIWDEWQDDQGTIGESYGWIVRKYGLIDKLIDGLIRDPQSRRHIMNLYQEPHLDKGTLYPCCFMSMWDVGRDGTLNLMVVQRSADVPLGLPFNVSQYAVLCHMVAQVTGLTPGQYTHVINNAHIYINQVAGINRQLERAEQALPAPKLLVNPAIKNFYDFTLEDIQLDGYNHLGKIDMPVSI